jgi:hypothetical protein
MDRLKEASTWAGFGVMFQACKLFVPAQFHIYLDGASAVAGALAGVVPEKAKAA